MVRPAQDHLFATSECGSFHRQETLRHRGPGRVERLPWKAAQPQLLSTATCPDNPKSKVPSLSGALSPVLTMTSVAGAASKLEQCVRVGTSPPNCTLIIVHGVEWKRSRALSWRSSSVV